MIEVDVSNGFDLGCFHYPVLSSKEVSKELASRGHFGECSFDSHTVRVSEDFNTDQHHNTFLHEVIEAVNEENCNNKIKHTEITNLANGLSQVFKSMGVIFGVSKVKE